MVHTPAPDDDGLSGVGVGTDPNGWWGGLVCAPDRDTRPDDLRNVLDEDGNNERKKERERRGHGGGDQK